jgi:apolipoprotein N-acyltransferase
LVAGILIASIVYGRWRIRQADECVTVGPMAASLQSNVPQSVKETFESGQELFDGLMEKSKAAGQAGAEIVVWPETMVQATLNPEVLEFVDPNSTPRIFDQRLKQHAEDSAYLLIGAYGGELTLNKNMRLELGKRYNSAFLYKPDGEKAKEVYDKIHLVPFGEVLPLRRSMAWFYELLMKIKFIPYDFDYSLDYGKNYTIFDMIGEQSEEPAPHYTFAVIICYEGTVPDIARTFALDESGHKRVNWLINISNDGWFVRFKDDNVQPSMELPQHAAVCTFRAVENRLAIVRSVNTGISCMIDSLGRIRDGYVEGTLPEKAMDRTGMAGWFMDRIPIDSRTTFFSKYGEWLDYCCETVVILLIIGWLFRSVELKVRHTFGKKIYLAGKSHGK